MHVLWFKQGHQTLPNTMSQCRIGLIAWAVLRFLAKVTTWVSFLDSACMLLPDLAAAAFWLQPMWSLAPET